MLAIRSTRTVLLMGSLATAGMTGSVASAPVSANEILSVSDRCAVYGAGFVDLGNGTCGQIGRLRGGEAARDGGWGNGGASNAGLRSDGLGMMPGAGNARHLRIQADPDFR